MARRCTTVPGFGICCTVAQQGNLGRPFRYGPAGRERCAQCDVIQKTKNRGPGFRFRWHKSAQCGIVSGCPALAQAGGQGQIGGPVLSLPGF